MNISVQSIIIRILGKLLNDFGVFNETSCLVGKILITFNSSCTKQIQVVNIFEKELTKMEKRSAMSLTSKQSRNRTRTANIWSIRGSDSLDGL